ncbi:TrmH family RNA methyltransferase [Butyrivibrio sp. NC3005]|uniref:TrmH family RNA methyltransferase n=1 Tax=Butyrivibrio sp. NC3005 TaxID=1280685 RepID=UPI000418AC88|nr:RNA methyltransferase [Butyrivibrio sp. NC3005]
MITIKKITSLDIKELFPYTKLKESELQHFFEPNGGIFIAESPKVIDRALNYGCVPISVLIDEKCLEEHESSDILNRLDELEVDVTIYVSETAILQTISGFNLTRGMLCAMHRPQLSTIDQITYNTKRIAILENVVNPTNIGAIFRSAAAFNIDAVLLTQSCCDPLSRRSIRVSMGNVFQIPWTYISESNGNTSKLPLDTMEKLRNDGFKFASLALKKDSITLDDECLKKEKKLAIILGNEGHGLCDETIKHSDYTVIIPMSHNVDSLNVAAASAVAFWELTQKSKWR